MEYEVEQTCQEPIVQASRKIFDKVIGLLEVTNWNNNSGSIAFQYWTATACDMTLVTGYWYCFRLRLIIYTPLLAN